jgi:acetolactate synthase-1/2/3 large subunit
VLTIIFVNGGYEILKGEMVNVGAPKWGRRAEELLSMSNPQISWVKLAEGMGVEAVRATTAKELAAQIRHALSRKGPFLIEAQVV